MAGLSDGEQDTLFVDNSASSCDTKPPTESDLMCQKEAIYEKCSKASANRAIQDLS